MLLVLSNEYAHPALNSSYNELTNTGNQIDTNTDEITDREDLRLMSVNRHQFYSFLPKTIRDMKIVQL